ncbi:MAG: aminotransferase class V-fold PLP-dependent enzyme [Cyanobacteria bacterium J06628_4]
MTSSRPNTPTSRPLEPSPDEMHQLIATVMKYVTAAQMTSERSPVAGSGYRWLHRNDDDRKHAVALAQSVQSPLPEQGVDEAEALFKDLFERLAPYSLNTGSGGYMGFIPSGGLFHAAVADFVALALNRYVPIFMAAPGLAAIESQALQWLCDLIGLPNGAGGTFTSGGSIATLTAIHAARSQQFAHQPPEAWLKATVYVSDQAHYCLEKGLAICGLPLTNLRKIPVDECFRIRLDALADALKADAATGYQPLMIVGNGGTTNTGAVDPLPALAKMAHQYQAWFHVDAAYGGFFNLTARGRAMLQGIEQADSVVLDPHKSLFLPYGTGALLVKDRATLRQSFDFTGAYMPSQTEESFALEEDLLYLSPELTRDFRGLRVWLPLMLLGAEAFRTQLDAKLDLAQQAAKQLMVIPNIQLVASPQLSILAFKLSPRDAALSPMELDQLNKTFLDAINARDNILLTPFRGGCDGQFALRMAILSFRTSAANLQQGLRDISDAAQALSMSTNFSSQASTDTIRAEAMSVTV